MTTNVFIPDNYDLGGTWLMQNQPRFLEGYFPNAYYPVRGWFIQQNYAMLGRDNFTLKKVSTETELGFPGRITTHYTGIYHHYHAIGDELVHTNYDGTRVYGRDVLVNRACRIYPMDFQLTADWSVLVDARDQSIAGFRLHLSGQMIDPPETAHATSFTFDWYKLWPFGEAIGSEVHLFQDFAGNSILLFDNLFSYQTFDGPFPADNEPCGINTLDSFSRFEYRTSRLRLIEEGSPIRLRYYVSEFVNSFTEPILFIRSDGPSPANETALIEGKAKDQLNALEIKRGAASLYRQKGWIRPRQTGESEEDYDAYMAANLTLIAQTPLTSFGGFRFADVPLYQKADHGPWTVPLYAVEISNAESENAFLGGTPVLFYKTKIEPNLQPRGSDQPGYEIGLAAIPAIPAKRDVANFLLKVSTNNFAEVERRVLDRLRDYETGALDLTAEREEGLKRAVWAEKLVLEGSLQSSNLIRMMFDGVASAASDLLGRLLKQFQARGALGEKLNKALADSKATDPLNLSDFKLKPDEDVGAALSALSKAGQDSEFLGVLEKVVSAQSTVLQTLLQYAGLEQSQAGQIASVVGTVLKLSFTAIKTLTRLDTKSIFATALDEEIKSVIKQFPPVVFDNGPAKFQLPFAEPVTISVESFPSYCKSRAPLLQYSYDQMLQWPRDDSARYLGDTTEAAAKLQSLIDSGVEAQRRLLLEQAATKSLKSSGSVLGLFGTFGVPYFKQAAELSKAGAVFLNYVVIGDAAAQIFAIGPGYVSEGVYAAFGEKPPAQLSRQSGPAPAGVAPPPSALRGVLTNDFAAVLASLDALQSTLQADNLGAAVDETSALLDHFDTFRRTLDALGSIALALPNASHLEMESTISRLGREFDLLLAFDNVRYQMMSLFEGAYGNRYHGRADPAFVGERNVALNLIQALMGSVRAAYQPSLLWLEAHQSVPMLPAVQVSILSVSSDQTGKEAISINSDSFTVRVAARNLSSQVLSNLALRITVDGPTRAIAVEGASPTASFNLAPFGDNSAPFEAEWTLRYQGDFDHAPIYVSADLMQDGKDAAGLFASRATHLLNFDPALIDSDGDGLPDRWERAHGLDPARDDSAEDPDRDGLTNQQEFDQGTDPQNADSDGDSLSDGDELRGTTQSFRTDPLLADSDGDGVPDGADPYPLDPGNAGRPSAEPEPAIGLEVAAIRISESEAVVALAVTNRGGGTLYWSAESSDPTLVSVSPQAPASGANGDLLSLSLPSFFDASRAGTVRTTVRVIDVGGAIPDFQDLEVTVEGALPGAPDPVRFLSVFSEGQNLRLRISAPAGAGPKVEYSTDLRTWSTLTNLANPTGEIEFRTDLPKTRPAAFLRATTP